MNYEVCAKFNSELENVTSVVALKDLIKKSEKVGLVLIHRESSKTVDGVLKFSGFHTMFKCLLVDSDSQVEATEAICPFEGISSKLEFRCPVEERPPESVFL